MSNASTAPGRRFDRRHVLLACVLVLAAGLRLYPVHRGYVGPDTQEAYPRAAVIAVVESHWQPRWIVHGPFFFHVLRATYTGWYAAGRASGTYRRERDLLVDFATDPLAFIIAGRLVVVAFALVALVLVARLGGSLDPPSAGVAGAALLAVTFIHVRESHQVWPDVPAGTLVLAAVLASADALRRGGAGRIAIAGLLAGLAIATKPSAFPVLAPIALGALLGDGRLVARVGRAVIGGLAATGTYVAAAPYAVLALEAARSFMSRQYELTFGGPRNALSLGEHVMLGFGIPIAGLAAVGLVTSARRWPITSWLVAASFPIAYTIVLLLGSRLFIRYLALLAPFAALFAAHAVVTLAHVMAPRRGGLVATVAVVLLAARPAVLAVEYDRFLALDDTRALAGAWIEEHVPDDAEVLIPNPTGAVNPTLPPNTLQLGARYPAQWRSLRRELQSALRGWTVLYHGSVEHMTRPTTRERFVVTSEHPALFGHMNTPWLTVARLQQAGAREVARFAGTSGSLPPDVRYDPIDADYTPLRGWSALVRPGPNLTIWHLPARPAEAQPGPASPSR